MGAKLLPLDGDPFLAKLDELRKLADGPELGRLAVLERRYTVMAQEVTAGRDDRHARKRLEKFRRKMEGQL